MGVGETGRSWKKGIDLICMLIKSEHLIYNMEPTVDNTVLCNEVCLEWNLPSQTHSPPEVTMWGDDSINRLNDEKSFHNVYTYHIIPLHTLNIL